MDYLKHTNCNVQNQLLSHNSKRSIKFVLCFSLLCVLFSSIPLLIQTLKPFLMQFFSYIVEKSYMFLLCNGLLVLIAMNSGLINAPSVSPPSTHHMEKSIRLESKEADIAVPVTGENIAETESTQEDEEEEGNAPAIIDEDEEEEGNALAIIDEDEDEEGNALAIIDEDEDEEGNALATIDEDEDEDEHGVDFDDTEELNKKCEDFIKRMKATFSSNNLEPKLVDTFYFHDERSLVAVTVN